MTTSRETQQALLEQVKSGKNLFTKSTSGWMVYGLASQITVGATVTVTRANGTTSQVRIIEVTLTKTVQDVTYSVAKFAEVHTTSAVRDDRYTTVSSPLYGEGRVYRDLPGATNYRSSDGSFTTQIFDND